MLFLMLFYLLECSSNLTGRGYHRLLQYHVLPRLRVWNGGNLIRLLWQQDGVIVHVTDANMRYMDRKFDYRVISRRAVQKSCPHMRCFCVFEQSKFRVDII